MISYEFECWKCPKWHETDAAGAWQALVNGYARPALVIGRARLTIPRRVFWWLANAHR